MIFCMINMEFDKYGYNINGFDEKGLNKDGYDIYGFD